ncbi:hypothetical protein KVT40_001181 [Elsinoe batatas]|uniref:Uncharacterized protein n=1 Tax=Elsinoe batatas TaxID=2601811 RepID=A0A8K0PJC7_9PEZI|nr:hypothetical protein KVT40_001181 [Elsinoe batatas]
MTADQYLCSIIAEGSPEISTPASTSDQAVAPDSLHDTNPHIAVYNQVQHGRGNKDNDLFLFHGYYRVTGVTFCSPHSVALKDLLKRKWTWKDRQGNEVAKERDMDHWRESFKHEWAELKMEKDEEWEKENGPPKIEKKVVAAGKGRKERGEKKGVNELLKEMRLEGEKGVKVEQPNEVGTDTPKDTALKNTGEMTAGEFNQMHGRERYTVVFNAADGKEVDRTERSKGMVTPEESKEISKLEESKKMVEPSDTRGIVTPEESKEISKPQGSKKMNTTDDSKEAIIPEASKEKLDPGSFKEELDPEASNAVITAEDTKEVIPADKSEGTITIGISSDTFTTESSNAAISAEDSKDAISAEDFKGAVAGEGPKESIIIARGSQETPTIADPKEMAQEGTKD